VAGIQAKLQVKVYAVSRFGPFLHFQVTGHRQCQILPKLKQMLCCKLDHSVAHFKAPTGGLNRVRIDQLVFAEHAQARAVFL
jgi:hypothetical protein